MLISSKWVKHLAAVLFSVAAVLLFSPENPGAEMEPAIQNPLQIIQTVT